MGIALQDRGCRPGAPAGQPRVAVGAVAHERQVVGDGRRRHAELGLDRVGVHEAPARRSKVSTRPSSRTHWAMSLSGDRMTTRSTSGCSDEAGRGGRQGVVGLELDHGPDDHPEGLEGLLQQGELGQELRRHAGLGLVAGVALVAPGADDMVGGAAEVRDAVLAQQRQDRSRRRPGWRPRASLGARMGRPAEVRPEQLVGGVEEVDLHVGGRPLSCPWRMPRGVGGRSRSRRRSCLPSPAWPRPAPGRPPRVPPGPPRRPRR